MKFVVGVVPSRCGSVTPRMYVFASIHLPTSNVTLPVYIAAVVETIALLLRMRIRASKHVHRQCRSNLKVHFIFGMDANATPSSQSMLCGEHLQRGPYSNRTGVRTEALEQFLLLDVQFVITSDPPDAHDMFLSHTVGPAMLNTTCHHPHHTHRSWSAGTRHCIDFVASSLCTFPSTWAVPDMLATWKSTDHLPLAYVARLEVVLKPN